MPFILKPKLTSVLMCIISFFLVETAAKAGSFTTENAKTFALCLPDMNRLVQKLHSDSKVSSLFDEDNLSPLHEGKFRAFSRPLEKLKLVSPPAYKDVNEQAKLCGIESAEVFAHLGDRVMAAYVSKKMPPNMAAQMAQLTPQMQKMMPVEAKQAIAMMKALENVPEEDMAALTDDVVLMLDKASENTPILMPSLK